ncbi:MAG: polysaccharide deacetylase family protein [Elusimicrobiota bacterium]|jgi:peptidoglycan/xylan/chitin deacetylase (PgdA/CDA1 family)
MRLAALMYHDIEAAKTRNRYAFTLDEFRAHLAALRSAGLGAPAVWDAAGSERDGFALTFDDGCPGWRDAAQALESMGWRAFFFVTTGAIGRAGGIDQADIRRLAAAGHVVGSHSVDHPDRLAGRELDFIEDQWVRSKAALEDILGREVSAASVPGGAYGRKVGLAAAAAGIRHLFTSEPVLTSWNAGPCQVLGRFTLTNGMSAEAAAGLARGAAAQCWPQYLAWNLKKVLKATLNRPYRTLRKRWYAGTS